MDPHTGAILGDEAVPTGRKGRWMEATLMTGRWRQCQGGISDGQKDGRNRGGFLYNDVTNQHSLQVFVTGNQYLTIIDY